MSWKILNALIRMDIQPPTRKFVAIRMAIHAGEDFTCFPGMRRLAKDCGISENVARGHVKALQDSGILVSSPRFGSDGRQTSNLYRFNPRILAPLVMEEVKEMIDEGKENPAFSQIQKSESEFVGFQRSARKSTSGSRGESTAGSRGESTAGSTPSESSEGRTTNEGENTCPQGGQVMDEPAEEIPDEPPIDPLEARIPSEPPPVPAPPSARPRNPVFDAVAEAWGVSGEQTKSSGSLIGKAATQIKATMPGRPADEMAAEVRRRAANYRLKFPDCECTPSALIKHWPTLGVAPTRSSRTPLAADDRPWLIKENLKPKILNWT